MTDAPKRGRPRKERYALLMGGFWRNRKVRRLSLEARGLLATAWSYASDNMTDGAVPLELLAAWAGKRWPSIRAELTRGSAADGDHPFLTIPEGEIDAQCHDFTRVNISAEKWEQYLEGDRKRKRKPGDFPTGNPTGNASGNPADFRPGALDDDDDEEISDRAPPLETRRAPTPAPVVSSRVALDEDTGIARFAQLALDEALRADGGAYVMRDGDAGHFRTVAESANACRGKAGLRDVLGVWARDFSKEFRVRTARNFATYAQARAANGGARIASAPVRSGRPEDPTLSIDGGLAGSKPDQALAEARERDAKVARARAEAVPAPADFAALLRGGST